MSFDIDRRAKMRPSIYKFSDQYTKQTLDAVANTLVKNIEY